MLYLFSLSSVSPVLLSRGGGSFYFLFFVQAFLSPVPVSCVLPYRVDYCHVGLSVYFLRLLCRVEAVVVVEVVVGGLRFVVVDYLCGPSVPFLVFACQESS